MAKPTRAQILAGSVILAGGIYVLNGLGTEPEIFCDDSGCIEVTAPTTAPSTTTTTQATTTTTTGEETFPAPNVESEFDTTVSGPYRSAGSDNGSSASEPTGNFRVFCEFSHLGYYDPILAPGSSSFMHLHQFFGNTLTDGDSTYASLRSSGGGTCSGGPMNRTAYWMPALFNGDGDVMVPELFVAYYKVEQAGGGSLAQQQATLQTVQPYPNGFRYLGGRNPVTNTLYSGGFEWKCEGGSGAGSTIPNSCPGGEALLALVRFPHCWDGENAWLPDNAHVSGGTGGSTWEPCTDPDFPVYLPSLTEIAYFPSSSDMSDWYLSSDRMDANPANWYADGASFHADWYGAWDTGIQDVWVEECLRGLRNSNGALCDGTVLDGAANYTGPTEITGYTPMHSSFGEDGWPTGMGPS